MAGRGERFLKEGFVVPKPLIEINNKTMIEYAVESLDLDGKFIFIVYRYTDENLNKKLFEVLNRISPNCEIIQIDYITEGPAASSLLAKKFIDNEESLVITNCDQIMKWSSEEFINYVESSELDGIVVTYTSSTEKNSYIQVDDKGLGVKLAENEVISNLSLNGIHYWKTGKSFVESAEEMIKKNIRTNNEFYISLTYNEMINSNLKVGNFHINNNQHYAVGTPEDLKIYLDNENISI